jgi:hypothetical protein
LTLERGSRLVRLELNNALWSQASGALLLGGPCLFLAYVGTARIKIVVCASAIAAIWLVHKRPVSPFGNLLGYRPPAHLLDPALTPLRTALEAEKTRRLHHIGLGWLALVTGAIAAGVLHPSKLTAILTADKGVERLAAWPILQGAAEWALIATIIGALAVPGSAFVLWFAIHLLVLAERTRL